MDAKQLHSNSTWWIFANEFSSPFLRRFFGRSDEACVRFLNSYCDERTRNFSRFIRTNEFFAFSFAGFVDADFIPHTIRRRFFFVCVQIYLLSLFLWAMGIDNGHFIVVFNVRIWRWWRWRVDAGMMACRRFHRIHCYFSSSMTLDFVNIASSHDRKQNVQCSCVNPLIDSISADFVQCS